MSWLNSPLSVLSNETSAETVMDSLAAPTSSVASTRATWVASTGIFGRMYFLNPGAVTVIA